MDWGRLAEKLNIPQWGVRICIRPYIGDRSVSVYLGVLGWTGED